MSFRSRHRRTFVLGLALAGAPLGAGALVACSGGAPAPATQENGSEILGGVEASSARLDAVGSVGILADSPYADAGMPAQYQPLCSGTLIGPTTVVTAKHCVQNYPGGGLYTDYQDMYFGIGASALTPARVVLVAEVETAPMDTGGFAGFGRDVAVLHLAEAVSGVTPLAVDGLAARDVGRRFATLGYGLEYGAPGPYGQRRAGAVTLRALEGRTFELMFGSFEAYRDYLYATGYGYPVMDAGWADGTAYDGAAMDAGAFLATDPGTSPPPPPLDAGASDGGAAIDASPYDAGPAYDAGYDPEAWIRDQYENTRLLAGDEAYVGNRPGDAQPCRGDSGGPLIAKVNGKLRVVGVTSGALRGRTSECDYGAVVATFGPETRAFLAKALTWVDPCGGTSTSGRCDGTVATRCTGRGEGRRRLTTIDCQLLNLVCGSDTTGGAACVDPAMPPPGPLPATHAALDANAIHDQVTRAFEGHAGH